MEEFKLMISGCNGFDDFVLLNKWVDYLLARINGAKEIIIVCGAGKGADMLGERYAAEQGYEVAEFSVSQSVKEYLEPEVILEMAEFADACICFWDGECTITQAMIDLIGPVSPALTIIKFAAVDTRVFVSEAC